MKYALISIISYNINLNFTYQSEDNIEIGDIVLIELKNNKIWGIIIEIVQHPNNYLPKTILQILPLNNNYKLFIKQLSNYYLIYEKILYKKIINQLLYHPKKNIPLNSTITNKEILKLNHEQNLIYEKILDSFSATTKKPNLLHGITGSGKTFIYISLIKYYLNKNKSILCLFPNANLAHTILNEIKKYINDDICYEYHSQGTKESRKTVWQKIIENQAILICGVHIPLFLPILNLGLIIIDEEHDLGFCESRFPYINIKEAALIRAKIENIPILLSSATPSLSSFYLCQDNKYNYFKLKNRHFQTQLPLLSIVNMNKEEKKHGISNILSMEIKEALLKKEQVLLFFNKKGVYRYAQCKKCDYKFCCIQCNILLTIFAHHIAKCNRCNYKIILPEICPICKKENEIKTIGYGLNKLNQYIEKLFPEAKSITIDGDILKNKENAKKIITDINNKKYDIILGTQIISKGYNFNSVSLVGIINADQNFYIPHFMMMEESIQQYMQVSGRAGRKEGSGKVILQTFSDIQYLYPYLKEDNYDEFAQFELNFRKSLSLPPYIKMSSLIIKESCDESARILIEKIYQQIVSANTNLIKENTLNIFLPEKCMISKIKNKYYYQIVIKSHSYLLIQNAIKHIILGYNQNRIIINYIPNILLTSYE